MDFQYFETSNFSLSKHHFFALAPFITAYTVLGFIGSEQSFSNVVSTLSIYLSLLLGVFLLEKYRELSIENLLVFGVLVFATMTIESLIIVTYSLLFVQSTILFPTNIEYLARIAAGVYSGVLHAIISVSLGILLRYPLKSELKKALGISILSSAPLYFLMPQISETAVTSAISYSIEFIFQSLLPAILITAAIYVYNASKSNKANRVVKTILLISLMLIGLNILTFLYASIEIILLNLENFELEIVLLLNALILKTLERYRFYT